MARGKDYTTTEIAEIKGYLKDGCNYAEIGELMGRTRKSIEQLVLRQGWTRGRFRESSDNVAPVWKTTVVETEQELKKTESVPVKEKTLFDFPPREIIRHLYNLGYRIKGSDWKLVCTVEQTVNLKDIING